MAAPVEILTRVPLFEDLEPAELEAIAAAMREKTFAAGETLMAEGAPADGFFVLETGEADVTAGGRQLAAMGPGDHVGEIALLQGGERTATVTARSEVRCWTLAPLDFRAVVEGNPVLAWTLLETMMARLS